MRVANLVKIRYKGEILTVNQWLKRGYKPKDGEIPERMWSNQMCCCSGNSRKYTYDYYYDYQVEKINEHKEKRETGIEPVPK